jgi:hypothetical protein
MAKIGVAQRIVKPENCALAFGIPTSRETFLRDQAQDGEYFAKHYHGVWERYDHEVVRHLRKYAPLLKQLGVNVVEQLTLQHFGELFRDAKLDVVVLFSHWHDDAVEFHDGLALAPAIIEQIPVDFSGVLDLCVCHPESLTIALRRDRPRCLIRYTNKPATPYIWLYFYMELFNYLRQHDSTYLQALEEVIMRVIKPGEGAHETVAVSL